MKYFKVGEITIFCDDADSLTFPTMFGKSKPMANVTKVDAREKKVTKNLAAKFSSLCTKESEGQVEEKVAGPIENLKEEGSQANMWSNCNFCKDFTKAGLPLSRLISLITA